ncbi:phosphate acyltransferase PlsX [Arenicella xantha]|uniref:Phosphate acyltransferase n=1 Tax=Arenicella xantha TaxID=644221 RepID=A0A395JF96_9GAMM|nr:phosphate acyltransferase PlsX [Arenicella xantha]RBP48419.1 phosphate:acyl-[acyl carrier protein] acyltransferase [Arenicella xantha]
MSSKTPVVTVAVDAMGGDFGPEVTVPAAIAFLTKPHNSSHRIVLVGLVDMIEPIVQAKGGAALMNAGRLSIHAASEVVAMDESPALALKRKKDSSMRVAINLVKEGSAQAAVSAGNTGALMATARFVLKTIKGIDRPAIISTLPCLDPSKTVHMLDLGANVDSTPEMLVQFAVMGSVLTHYVDKKESPRVALLNVGAEEIKGSEKVKRASQLLSASSLNYVGYVEADEILFSKVDVIVCDGFEGNVALKASEGTAKMILSVLKEEFKSSLYSKLAGAVALPVFKSVQSRLDPRSHNGASLIGLNGIVVKSHGGTDVVGFEFAIQEARQQASRDVIGHISTEIGKVFTS